MRFDSQLKRLVDKLNDFHDHDFCVQDIRDYRSQIRRVYTWGTKITRFEYETMFGEHYYHDLKIPVPLFYDPKHKLIIFEQPLQAVGFTG